MILNFLITDTMDDPRAVVRGLFERALLLFPEWDKVPREDQEAIVRRIERSCYNQLIDDCVRDQVNRSFANKIFVDRYQAIVYRVLSNLDVNQSHYLFLGILKHITRDYITRDTNKSGANKHNTHDCTAGDIDFPEDIIEINPATVGSMTSQELCPAANKHERENISLRQMQKVEGHVSEKYKCSICGNKKTTILEYAGQSADEALKLSIQCVVCGHTWRK